MLYLVTIGFCYLCGSIPFGLILAKANGLDIREHGSGNIGATNVLRTLGKKWGYACFTLDFLKGLLPVLIISIFFNKNYPELADFATIIALPATISGHIFSIFLKFKGGKGVATGAGAVMAICPPAVSLALVIWFICFKMTGYVSLASIIAAIFVPIIAIALSSAQIIDVSQAQLILLTILATLVTYMHRSNIKRLCNGTESCFKKKEKQS